MRKFIERIRCFFWDHEMCTSIEVKVTEGKLKICRCINCHRITDILFLREFKGEQ